MEVNSEKRKQVLMVMRGEAILKEAYCQAAYAFVPERMGSSIHPSVGDIENVEGTLRCLKTWAEMHGIDWNSLIKVVNES